MLALHRCPPCACVCPPLLRKLISNSSVCCLEYLFLPGPRDAWRWAVATGEAAVAAYLVQWCTHYCDVPDAYLCSVATTKQSSVRVASDIGVPRKRRCCYCGGDPSLEYLPTGGVLCALGVLSSILQLLLFVFWVSVHLRRAGAYRCCA